MAKTRISFFSYDTETTRTTYQVLILYSSSSYCCRCSLQQVPRSYCDAVNIESRPPSPSTWRLCARSSRTLFRFQASSDGSRMQGVLGESRASCRLSSWAGSKSGSQKQQYEELVDNSLRWLTSTASSAPDAVLSSWLRARRVRACIRPLQSVQAAAELVWRRRVVVLVCMSRVLQWDVLYC